MIRIENLSVRFERPVLHDVELTVNEGDLCVVIGATGSGKSTLLRTLNGMVPHFTGGSLGGDVRIDGRSIRNHPPRELADTVGMVLQDPSWGFVTGTVEEEIAYGLEQLGLGHAVMRKRVEETLDLMGLAPVRRRRLGELSGGQQQRVAIGAALAAHPRVLVLDEPTSALDPTAAEDVLASIARLVHDLGVTVVLAEHRLERVLHHADLVVEVVDGTVRHGSPTEIMSTARIAPPVVELGRALNLDPVPLTVRDARRALATLWPDHDSRPSTGPAVDAAARPDGGVVNGSVADDRRDLAVRVRGLTVRYGSAVALRGVDLDLSGGDVVVVMGRNGAGKSSLLWAVHGAGRRSAGTVEVDGVDPVSRPAGVGRLPGRRLTALVPQTPSDLLYRPTVDEECATADADNAAPPGTTRAALDELVDGVDPLAHPHDLSEGQRLALALAVQTATAPRVVALDEPTRGLDYAAKSQLARILSSLSASGCAVLVATHDVEFAAEIAHRVVILADGEIVAEGSAADVLCGSQAFAPQIAKVAAPRPIHQLGRLVAEVEGR